MLLRCTRVNCGLRAPVGLLKKGVVEKGFWKTVSTMGKKPAERTFWLNNDARSWRLYIVQMAFWIENLKKAGWVRGEMSSLTLRWLRMGKMEEMQRMRCWR